MPKAFIVKLFPWTMGFFLVLGSLYSYINIENAFGYEWALSLMAKNSKEYLQYQQFAGSFEHNAVGSLLVVILSGLGLFIPKMFRGT